MWETHKELERDLNDGIGAGNSHSLTVFHEYTSVCLPVFNEHFLFLDVGRKDCMCR